MFDSKFIEETAKKITDAIPDTIQPVSDEIKNCIHQVLLDCFSKLNLVTRDEFDTQIKVLAKTRAKLDELEEKIKNMEKIVK